MGAGIAASGIARERLFITTKVQPQRMGDGDLQRSVEESLRKLGVSQVDLLLLALAQSRRSRSPTAFAR